MKELSLHTDLTMNTTDSCSRARADNKYYEQRLKTFYNWPKQMIPDKYALAKAGYLYTGQGDKVVCFQCGVGIYDWERTDDVWKEHYKWNPNCDYLKMVGWHEGINVPDTQRKGFGGFGQVETSTPSGKTAVGGFGLPKPQAPTAMDIDERPFGQITQPLNTGFKLGTTPKTDSNLFVYRY